MFTLVRRTPISGPRTDCTIGIQNCFDLEVLWNSTQKLVICRYSTSQCALLQLAGRRDILDHHSPTLSPNGNTEQPTKLLWLKLLITRFSRLVEGRVVISHNQRVLLTPPNLLLNLMREWGQNWQKQRGPNIRWGSNCLWEIDGWKSCRRRLCQVTFIGHRLQLVTTAAWGKIGLHAEPTQATTATSHNYLEPEVVF